MSVAQRARYLAWVVALVPACFQPSYDRPACSASGECPGELTCNAGFCVPSGEAISCVGLAMTCGPSGTDSCCNSLVIPGGTYYRSYDTARDEESGTRDFPAMLSRFRLDKYEVTVGRFRAFVDAGSGTQASPPTTGAGAHALITGSGWDAAWNTSLETSSEALKTEVKCKGTIPTWTDTPGGNESRPINCITWFEAMAFCAWDGGFLPTEAEWNYAATGGNAQRAYPWSEDLNTLDGMHASYRDGTDCVGDGMPGCALTDLVAVGTKPSGNGRWGQSDLAGNVFEWTLDWWAETYQLPCVDCADITPSVRPEDATRVFRGGSFYGVATDLRTAKRRNTTPINRDGGIGVRCARAP